MAHLKVKRIRQGRYYYIVQSVRRGAKVSQKILEYLGRDPAPRRLKRALAYWGVKAKPGKGGR
jgi:hypothetical protein